MANITERCSIASQNKFGPVNPTCNGGFDFTLLFEETILTIGPLSLMLLIVLYRIPSLLGSKRKVSWGVSFFIKQVNFLLRRLFQSKLCLILIGFCNFVPLIEIYTSWILGHQSSSKDQGIDNMLCFGSCRSLSNLSSLAFRAFQDRSAIRSPH